DRSCPLESVWKKFHTICKRFLQHGDADHVLGRGGEDLHILAQTPKQTQLGEGALNHPTLGQHSPVVFDFDI
ncbi:hypothetical protein, partial [Thiorhodococcus drewsii]|uniref:hypothetical protein n=1 Tax=Thiorhodococcus drewsii TaxID=210408 RepID=UPI000594103F